MKWSWFKRRHSKLSILQQVCTCLPYKLFVQQRHILSLMFIFSRHSLILLSRSAIFLSSSSSGSCLIKSLPPFPVISLYCLFRHVSGSPFVNVNMTAAVSGAMCFYTVVCSFIFGFGLPFSSSSLLGTVTTLVSSTV